MRAVFAAVLMVLLFVSSPALAQRPSTGELFEKAVGSAVTNSNATVVMVNKTPAAVPVGTAYPEYYKGRPDPTKTAPYTLPDFEGKTHYWAAYWNIPGFYCDTEPQKPGDFAAVVTDDWDGIAYDGRFLHNPTVRTDLGRVYFTYNVQQDESGARRYFLMEDVTTDPRLTNWWMSFAAEPAASLWKAVENGAITQGYPEVTWAIINHMVACGVVEQGSFGSLTIDEICEAILDYTDLALNWRLQQTLTAVGSNALTKQRFDSAKPGDKLTLYYQSRFGPVPNPGWSYEVKSRNAEGLLVTRSDGEEMNPFSWAYLEPRAPFIAYVAAK